MTRSCDNKTMARISLFLVWITYTIAFANTNENIVASSTKQIRRERNIHDFLHPHLNEKIPNLDNPQKVVDVSTAKVLFEIKIPDNCSREGICEHVENYPYELASKVAKKIGYDTIRLVRDPVPKMKINRRIGCGMELCDYEDKYIIPQAAPNDKGEWKVIIYERDRILQGFKVQRCLKCKDENKKEQPCSCSTWLRSDLIGICEQVYVNRKMYALLPNGSYITDLFPVPAYCTCKVSERFNDKTNDISSENL